LIGNELMLEVLNRSPNGCCGVTGGVMLGRDETGRCRVEIVTAEPTTIEWTIGGVPSRTLLMKRWYHVKSEPIGPKTTRGWKRPTDFAEYFLRGVSEFRPESRRQHADVVVSQERRRLYRLTTSTLWASIAPS
jgi:hypothetical protein